MHSANHAGSGTTVIIRDPTTGMAINLTYAPGQMSKHVVVEMNGQTYPVKAELVQVATESEEDLALKLWANFSSAVSAAIQSKAPKPHPATSVDWMDAQQAARREAVKQSDKIEKAQERGDAPPNFLMTKKELEETEKALKDAKPLKDLDATPGLPNLSETDSDINPDFVMDEDEAKANLEAAKPKGEKPVSDDVELVETVPVKESAKAPAPPAPPAPPAKTSKK